MKNNNPSPSKSIPPEYNHLHWSFRAHLNMLQFGTEGIVFDTRTGHTFHCNHSAVFLMRKLADKAITTDMIVAQLVSHFALAPTRAQRELNECAQQLRILFS